MKVLSQKPEPVIPPISIEFEGDERRNLARLLNTLDWSTLPSDIEDFASSLFGELVGDLDIDPGYIEGVGVLG